MTKLIITVRGGIVQSVISNQNIEYVINDYDNERDGGAVSSEILAADQVVPELDLNNPFLYD